MNANHSNDQNAKINNPQDNAATKTSPPPPSNLPAPTLTAKSTNPPLPTPKTSPQPPPEKPASPTPTQAPQHTIQASTAPATDTEPFPPFPVSLPATCDDAVAVRDYLAYVFSDVVSTRRAYELAGRWREGDGGGELRSWRVETLRGLFCGGEVEEEAEVASAVGAVEYLYERVKVDREVEGVREARNGRKERLGDVFALDAEKGARSAARTRRRTTVDSMEEEEGEDRMWRIKEDTGGDEIGRGQEGESEGGNVIIPVLTQVLLVGVGLCACMGGFAMAISIGFEVFRYFRF